MATLVLEKLIEGARRFGWQLDSKQLVKFDSFAALLLSGGKSQSLIGRGDRERVLERHILDSLSCAASGALAGADTVIDVGSGAGLPGIPLAIVFPRTRFTLLEPTRKRAAFLKEAAAKLQLENITVLERRAEVAGRDEEYRGAFDVGVARAVAPLPVLVEYALPFLKVGGRLVAQRGPTAGADVEKAGLAIRELGGRLLEVVEVDVPYLEVERRLVVIEKTTETPARYPRRSGIPAKRPLV